MKPDAQEIADIQTDLTRLWHEHTPSASGDGFIRLVTENHLRNFLLWHEEDIARRDDLGFERVFRAKRAIDELNAPQRPRSAVQTTSKWVLSLPVPASKAGADGVPATLSAILDNIAFIRSA